MSRSIQNYVLSLQQKLYPKIVGKMHKSCFLDIVARFTRHILKCRQLMRSGGEKQPGNIT